MPAFASGEGANCWRRQGYIFVVGGLAPRVVGITGGCTKGRQYRKSLALRFYGSSSSIMHRKSTIKPLLHRGELPVLNHCVQRALKTRRRLAKTLGETAKGKIDSFMIVKRATLKLGSQCEQPRFQGIGFLREYMQMYSPMSLPLWGSLNRINRSRTIWSIKLTIVKCKKYQSILSRLPWIFSSKLLRGFWVTYLRVLIHH